MSKVVHKPAYLLHKATGQARVRIGGKDHYLGTYGSPSSRARYEKLIKDWFAANRTQLVAASGALLTIDDLALAYCEHAESYYRDSQGHPTSEIGSIKTALRPLIQRCGTMLVADFGPLALKQVREDFIDRGHHRKSINSLLHRIRRMFNWGVENEMVDATVYQALLSVKALRAGRTRAAESVPISPVADVILQATLPYLAPVVVDMVRLQRATGARPGEICSIRPMDIERSTSVWQYTPSQHKTAHHGKERRIYIGPEGQAILAPYLDREPDEFCFSPAESERKRRGVVHQKRRTPLDQGNRPGTNRREQPKRRPNRCYDRTAYTRAIVRACELAFEMPKDLRIISPSLSRDVKEERRKKAREWRAKHVWSPNQIRHTVATELREKFGIEAAQVVLGHSDLAVTEIYAERNFEKAAEIMRKIG